MGEIWMMNPVRMSCSAVADAARAVLLALSFLSASLLAATASQAEEVRDALETALSGLVGQPIVIESVIPSPAPGISEVKILNGPVLYATEDGAYFFLNGDLHQTTASGATNLAEQSRSKIRVEQLAKIGAAEMVVFGPPGETRDFITIFTDVTCFYCQKLHREVDQLNAMGIEVRYLAFPRGGIPSEGATKLATAWCADDQQTTLTELKAGVDLPLNECVDNPIAAQYELGQIMGVSGTPAIITSSGMMIPGYRPAADIAGILGLN